MKKQILGGLAIILGLSYLLGTSQIGAPRKTKVVMDSVVYITNKKQTSGGTGFHVRAPSGAIYILTNGHVCEGVGKDGLLYVRFNEEDRPIPRHIIEESPITDLCLVEAMPQGKPAQLAESNPKAGDELKAIGHPKLMPLTLTRGSMIGNALVRILLSIGPITPGECEDPKNEKMDLPVFGLTTQACLLRLSAISTTVPILPGSSGSPVLNSAGEVAGIAFAGDMESLWAMVLPISDAHTFLEPY